MKGIPSGPGDEFPLYFKLVSISLRRTCHAAGLVGSGWRFGRCLPSGPKCVGVDVACVPTVGVTVEAVCGVVWVCSRASCSGSSVGVPLGLSCGSELSHCCNKLLLMGEWRNVWRQCSASRSAISLGSVAKLPSPSSIAPMALQLPAWSFSIVSVCCSSGCWSENPHCSLWFDGVPLVAHL